MLFAMHFTVLFRFRLDRNIGADSENQESGSSSLIQKIQWPHCEINIYESHDAYMMGNVMKHNHMMDK